MEDTRKRTQLSRSEPEEQGVSSQAILSFLDALKAGSYHTHSFMFVRHRHVIAEGWWSPYGPEHRRYVYSLSKSFTSTAVGLAVAEGLLEVDDRVVSFFPGDLPPSVGENLAAMRVRDLLTMSTGHAVDSMLVLLTPGLANWAQAILALPVEFPPGTHFLYNTGASYLLSAIVQKVSGQTVLDYLTPRLFQPLGIADATWDVCPRGVSAGGWGLSLKTEDMARFGLLYLQKGTWSAQRLLAAAWVEQATAAQVRNDSAGRENEPADWRQGYGYQFWRCQHGAYRADGAAGQFCIVMPEQDAVIAITSETNDMQGVLDRIWQHLLPAMQEGPIAAHPAARAQLHTTLTSLALPAPPAQPHPAIAPAISGRRYSVQPNGLDVRSASFSFEDGSCRFSLSDGQGEHEIVCGNGAWVQNETMLPIMLPSMMYFLLGQKGRDPLKVAAHGTWVDPQTLVLTWQYLETPHSGTVTCRFLGDEVHLVATSSMAEPDSPLLAGWENRLKGTLAEGA